MLRKMLIICDLRNAHKLFFLNANYSKQLLGAECVVYRVHMHYYYYVFLYYYYYREYSLTFRKKFDTIKGWWEGNRASPKIDFIFVGICVCIYILYL